jgi:hypothetical protein
MRAHAVQESYLSALGKENAFDRALKGLRLLSSHNCVHLSQGILAWIKSTSLEISQKYRSAENFLVVHGVCKRVRPDRCITHEEN